jgi:hypothetical protein
MNEREKLGEGSQNGPTFDSPALISFQSYYPLCLCGSVEREF